MGRIRMAHSLELGGGGLVGYDGRQIFASGPVRVDPNHRTGFLTGGAFDPEGGLAAVVVLLIGISVVGIRARRCWGPEVAKTCGA